MLKEITHSWLEVEIDGKWVSVDTYINDITLHNAAVRKLKSKGWNTCFSVSRLSGEPSAQLNLNNTHTHKWLQLLVIMAPVNNPLSSLKDLII